jgi:competence protein ComEA
MPHEGEDTPLLSMWQIYQIPILLGLFSLLCIVLSITILIKSYQDVEPIKFRNAVSESSASGEKNIQQTILVDIEGAVVNPGLYRLPQNARIHDLLTEAGGFINTADIAQVNKTINRAAVLTDGAKLYIPFIEEKTTTANLAQGGMISVNTATATELATLPGVGTAIAEKIITGRPYLSLDELVQKGAMSESLFSKCKEQLAL